MLGDLRALTLGGVALFAAAAFAAANAGLGEAYWRKYQLTHDKAWANAALQNCRKGAERDPALAAAGWGVVEGSRIRREYPITLGRIEGPGRRGKALTAEKAVELAMRSKAEGKPFDPTRCFA